MLILNCLFKGIKIERYLKNEYQSIEQGRRNEKGGAYCC